MSSEEDTRKKTISEILTDIGLGQYAQKFEDNMISIEHVQYMTDDDFASLGISVIGIRLKIKQACQTYLKGIQSSPVVSKFKELISKRQRRGKRNEPKTEKGTRRIYLGWKHRASMVYKMVGPNDGGGRQVIDVPKECDFEELQTQILNVYFPDGRSEARGLDLKNLNFFIASFSGHELPKLEEFGGFTVGNYFRFTKSSPVRLYLHTSYREIDKTASLSGPRNVNAAVRSDSSEDELPSLSHVSRNRNTVTNTSRPHSSASESLLPTSLRMGSQSLVDHILSTPMELDQHPAVQTTTVTTTNTNIENFIEQSSATSIPVMFVENLPTASHTEPDFPAQQQLETTFINADTPVVQFRVQRNLSLHQRRSAPDQQPSASRMSRHGDISCPVEIVDSEDEEIERSILSAAPHRDCPPEPKPANLTDLLKELQQKALVEDCRSTVIVSRSSVLKSAFSALSRPSFAPRGNLYIKFSGEIGEDYGGPRREFFRLAIQELRTSNIFEGPEDSRYFSHNVDLLQKNKYFLAGQLLALSLAHDGPSYICLNEHLFNFMVEDDSPLFDCVRILPDDIQNIISELRAISTEPERERFLVDHGDWLIDQGLVDIYRLNISSKEEYALLLQKQYICFRTSAEVAQFIKGMDTFDIWGLVRANTAVFKPLFCNKPNSLARKEDFDSLYQYIRSEEGSNNYTAEETSIYAWEIFLQDIEDKVIPVTFKELLIFITGADSVPVLGFSKKIEVMFYSQEPGSCRLPYVSTCGLQIWLPRGTDALSEILVRAMKESQGFHKI